MGSNGHDGEMMKSIADATIHAAHRRDHHHEPGAECSPHVVETIDLGPLSCVVCHCCDFATEFCSEATAKYAARDHKSQL